MTTDDKPQQNPTTPGAEPLCKKPLGAPWGACGGTKDEHERYGLDHPFQPDTPGAEPSEERQTLCTCGQAKLTHIQGNDPECQYWKPAAPAPGDDTFLDIYHEAASRCRPAVGAAAGEENERECPACGGRVCYPQSIARRVEENDEKRRRP